MCRAYLFETLETLHVRFQRLSACARTSAADAVSDLGEPDNASYRRYADLGRAAAVWNVVAAPELSLTLKTWCFVVVGCVGYRGYYDEADAAAEAVALRSAGYEPFTQTIRATLGHAGGLRIDHVMGLFRLWWVPPGRSAADGTYVSYDADAMLGVLALEAVRAGVVVVGEDLGTVEDRVRTTLEQAGVLGSAVLWFERDATTGAHLAPSLWREAALASVTTHDLPTAAGLLADEHVRVRHELGQLGVPLEQERERARLEREGLLGMLEREGLLAAHGGDVVLAMHAAVATSPCRIVLAAFGDAVGDLRQPNLPGTVDEYPNWRLPVADGDGRPLSLEELLASPGVRRLTALLQTSVRSPEAAGRPIGSGP